MPCPLINRRVLSPARRRRGGGRTLRKRQLILFGCVLTGAALMLLPTMWNHTRWTGPVEFILLSLAALPLGFWSVSVRGSAIYADIGPQLVACVFLGPMAAALVKLVTGIGALVTRRPRWFLVVLAGGHTVLGVTASFWLLEAMGVHSGILSASSGVQVAGTLLAAGVAFAVVQTVIDSLVTSVVLYLLGKRSSPWESFHPGSEESRWQLLTLAVTIPAAVAYAGLYLYWGVAGAFLGTLLTLGIGWLLKRHWHLTEQAQALQDRAWRDPLTGLYNRAHLMDLLQRQLAECAEAQRPMALLFIDLNEFGAFNNRHGHLSGDRVLTQVARSLEQGVGDRGTVARYAGDEFVVVLPGAAYREAEAVADGIRASLTSVTCSIGVSVYPTDGTDALTLLDVADRRMYAFKHANGKPASGEAPPPGPLDEVEPRVETGPGPRRAAGAGPAVRHHLYLKD
ncbi:MAG: hypothetical protein DIU84_10550 [Bacillota bacterium]|nr:MAG: hypothetical protein DIU84_10550 [Bacillota bacterium]